MRLSFYPCRTFARRHGERSEAIERVCIAAPLDRFASLAMTEVWLTAPAHVRGAAADHREFVIDQRRVLALLPGRAIVGVVGEAIDARRR
jgi:hypothetical protein